MTDIISISRTLLYGYDKKYVEYSKNVALLVEKAMPMARKMLDLPSLLYVELKPTRLPNAYYSHDHLKVVIDPRKCNTLTKALRALMHELVHAEQFKQGRLEVNTKTMMWMGKPVKMETRDYEKYRAQPWEKEAFDREYSLAHMIAENLKGER